ncbi:MAG: CPBP family intramembrane glutamic endopeptidase [Pyrinomonadaceae bacterium]
MSTPKDFSPAAPLPLDEFGALASESPAPPADASPDPDNPPWEISSAVGVWIISVALLFVMPIPFIIPYVLLKGIRFEALGQFLTTDKTAIFLQILAIIPVHLLTLAAAWAVITHFGKRPFFWRALGWSWSEQFDARKGIILGVVLFGVGALIQVFFGGQETQIDKIVASSRATAYLTAFLATFTAPLVEEVVYRGLLYSALQKAFGVRWGIISVLALFTLVHVPQYWSNFGVIAAVGILSAALTIVRAYSGRLLPCFIIHLIFNGITSVLIILQPYLQRFGSHSDGQKAAGLLCFARALLRAFI